MTNRHMVKPSLAAKSAAASGSAGLPEPNRTPMPAMPAPEDSPTPTTHEEPVDSPQPNASVKREAPDAGEIGLSTRR
nr:hypothetical protein [Methylobacterium sp. Leaf123]